MGERDREKIQAIHRELHSHLPSEPALRVKALESLLVDKGMLRSDSVDRWVEVYSEEIGPKQGAQVVAKSWCDPAFKERLMADAGLAVAELGFDSWPPGHLKAVANEAGKHNLVVCTLCSCYPLSLLGIPPNWYKMAAYRSRAVRDPRGVLAEFGVQLGEEVALRVWDSTAELRYLVVPERPAGTEDWSEEKLARLVTRSAMIGTQRDLDLSLAETV